MDLKNLIWLVALIPLVTNALTTMTTDNPTLGAIAGIIPAILVIKVLQGEGVDSKAILNLILIMSILPSLMASLNTEDPTTQAIVQLIPVFVIMQLFDKL